MSQSRHRLAIMMPKPLRSFCPVAREAVEKAVEKSVVTEVEHASVESELKFPPPRNPHFVGRSSTLAKFLSLWKPGHKSRLAVVGLGGIGYVFLPAFMV